MLGMMPDDIPHTDDKAKRKIHPLAKGCFIISLVPVVLLFVGLVFLFIDSYAEAASGFVGYGGIIMALTILAALVLSLFAQPAGILLGICSLLEMREDRSYCGKAYAIAGMVISTLATAAIILLKPLWLRWFFWRGW